MKNAKTIRIVRAVQRVVAAAKELTTAEKALRQRRKVSARRAGQKKEVRRD